MKLISKAFIGAAVAAATIIPVVASEQTSRRASFNAEKETTAASEDATAASRRAASGIPAKKVYAFKMRNQNVPNGIISFNLNDPQQVASEFDYTGSLAYAGCYANGKYYLDRYKTTTDSWEHIAFSSVDLSTGKITDIKSWKDEYFVVNDMTYDYSTNTIYAMVSNIYIDDFLPSFYFQYSGIWTINATTGVPTEIKQFIDWENATLGNTTYYTIAADMNGTLYAVDGAGYLVKFDRDNDFAEVVIGPTGVTDINHTTQTMEFDHSTGMLYWCVDHSKTASELVVIDPVTARATVVGPTGADNHLVGLYIPFDVPSQAAPAAVTDYTAVPDAGGANKITLNWTNPAKSFGGYNLTSISNVKVLRNDVEVASLTGATPSGEMTWTDENVPEAGNYTYTVVATNTAGKGMPSGLTRWVGYDVPAAVSRLGIGKTDAGEAYLEWEAPTEGMHGGVIDASTLGYKVIRFPDGTIIANDLKETTYTDKTIPSIGRYYYTIEPHTSAGPGEAKNTVEIAIGSGIENFPWNTLFADESEFDLWTVDNHNGGATWIWKSNTVTAPNGGKYYAQAKYSYDSQPADDYLISPDMLLKKGGRYKLKYAYSGSNTYWTEKLEITFGQGKTAEAQKTVLQSHTMKDGTMRYNEIDLPEVEETGNYNFAFHAISDAGQLGINVCDVTVSMTVAPPEEEDPKDPEDQYVFTAPYNLAASVDKDRVTLTWNEATTGGGNTGTSTNIYEDFETMPKWSINPEGIYGWSYIDGDKGIPYVDDYYDMPYPTDGMPLAAMVMAPYELDTHVYIPNPPHSGDQYLLFKSNFYQGDRTRPAPAPDDWFISPELNFGTDFIFSFYCKADPDADNIGDDYGYTFDRWNTEEFRVGYSTTGKNPEDFVWMTDENEKVTTSMDEWKKKEYVMPADAKYVCIHYCTPENGYWFMVDDVFIGVENPSMGVRQNAEPIFYYYEVLVDDDVVGTTQECTYTVEGVAIGTHVAKVRAVYKQGNSETISAPFTVTTSAGVDRVNAAVSVYPNPASEIVYFGSSVARAELYSFSGMVLKSVTNAESMTLEGVAPGLYLLRLDDNSGNIRTVRLIVK